MPTLAKWILTWLLLTVGTVVAGKSIASPSLVRSCIKVDEPALGMQASQAQQLIARIAYSIGLQTEGIKTIVCDSLDNAEAYYENGDHANVPQGEYIAFNPAWVRSVAGSDVTQVYAIFGHEFGHLIGRHSFKPNMSGHDKELEADSFAGCAVARMEGNWDALMNLLERIRPEVSGAYPSADESVGVAKKGFETCGGRVPGEPSPSPNEAGWIYVGFYDDKWDEGVILDGLGDTSPEDLEGQQFVLARGANLRDGPFVATRQLPNGGCKHRESKIIGGLAERTSVTINKIYRLDGDWCQRFVWAQVTPNE